MPPDVDHGRPRGDEIEAVEALVGAAPHFAPGGMRDWLARVGAEHVRALRRDGRIIAGLALIPMGQRFGGVGVPMTGVTAAVVAGDQRGWGVGTALPRALLAEPRESGTPLSALYPASLAFYRRAGHERAWHRLSHEASIDGIDIRDAPAAGWWRIVDAAGALTGRGYPPGLRGDPHLAIRDDLLSANQGHWRLTVADGQGRVERGGQGRLHLDVRDLAAIFTGFITPLELLALGTLDGPWADLTLAAALFAAPRPWLADMF